MESTSGALIASEKWLDRLEFQSGFGGLFQRGTGRDFDDCLTHLSDGARRSIEARMIDLLATAN